MLRSVLMIKKTVITEIIFFWIILLPSIFFFPLEAIGSSDEIKTLKNQIEILYDRILELEKKQAETEKLNQRIQVVEEKQIVAEKAPKMKAYWKNGFRIEYKDPENEREYKFRFRTGIQFRYTYVDTDDDILFNGSATGKNVDHTENYSSFNMRRLRFYVDGTAPTRDWKYYVQIQLEPQGSVNAHDAIIQWQKHKEFKIQFGRIKIPAFGLEFWQSGFGQNGTDRTIFTGDSEYDRNIFGNRVYDFPGSNARLRVGNQRLRNGFSTGGFTLYRSQGFNINGYLDILNKKDFLTYWLGVYNGRDTRGFNNDDDEMLYTMRFGLNFLPGSDPEGPMGPKAFKNYSAQGDYGFNTTPLAAFIASFFWDRDKTKTNYIVSADAGTGFMDTASLVHDIENYGFSGTLLFRYLGFSADLEYAWEEFIQEGSDEEAWRRQGARLNLGYFIIPKKWEIVSKIAFVERIKNNDLKDSIKSGLGLVKLKDGFTVEESLEQYILGLNYYLHGFNQYITADLCWYHRNFDKVSTREANALGLDPASFSLSPDDQDEIRFRVMYQHLF